MPNGLIPDEGLAAELVRILNPLGADSHSWRLILWVNDVVPDAATVVADLVPASFGGYSFVTLNASTWTAPEVDDGCATSYYGTEAIQWLVSDAMGQTVYGFALIDTTANVIRFVQRFDSADIVPLETGGRVLLLPQFTYTSAACPGSMIGARARARRRKKKVKRA